MISAVLDHLWQSTVVALAAGALALALRKARASVRYGLWLAASTKFLIPFAALAALGRLLAPAVRPPAETAPDAALIARAAQPFSAAAAAASPAHAVAAPAIHAAPAIDAAPILAAAWALGCAAVLVVWLVRWSRVRSTVRRATPVPLPAPMPVLASPWMLEPGLVGLWRPVLLVPQTLFGHLAERELAALVAHEACHQRRRDNLTAAMHMAAEALFWFHPLVWWIGARLIEERERACDEAVVGAGHDRAAYARALVECCRLYLQSPLSCVAGAAGSNLVKRVEMIMTAPLRRPLKRRARALLAAAGICAVATPVAAGWLASPAGQAASARVGAIVAAPVRAAIQPPPPAEAHPVAALRAAELIQPARAEVAPAAALAPQALGLVEYNDHAPFVGSRPLPAVVRTDVSELPAPDDLHPRIARRTAPDDTLSQATQAPATSLVPVALPAGGAILRSPPWRYIPPFPRDAQRADAAHLGGRVVLQCTASGQRLYGCQVVEETPAGFDLGPMALLTSLQYRLWPTDLDGRSIEGRPVRVVIDFPVPRGVTVVRPGEPTDPARAFALWRRFNDLPVDGWPPHGANSPGTYPEKARQRGISGVVRVRCQVGGGGEVRNCQALREDPVGWGFAAAALSILNTHPHDWLIQDRSEDGRPTAGGFIEFDLTYNRD